MSILDELELRTQLEARRALGAAALGAWARGRLPLEPSSRARAECVRAALVVALEAGDAETVEALAPLLSERPRVDSAALLSACETSPRASLAAQTLSPLLEADPSAAGWLIASSVAERRGRLDEAERFARRALSDAEAVADLESARAARVELVRLLSLVGREVDALALAAELERDQVGASPALDARAQLVLARAELVASGRYLRARALDRLVDVASRGEVAARASLRLFAAHLDRVGTSITDVEIERARGLLASARRSGIPEVALTTLGAALDDARADDAEREARIVRELRRSPEGAALVERVRAVRDGGTAGPRPIDRSAQTAWRPLAVLAHVRARRLGEARGLLREIASAGESPTVAGWTMIARAARERALHETLFALATRWLDDRAAVSPRRGFVDLAAHLERAGLVDLAGVALARARVAHEEGARELAIQHAIRRAWAWHRSSLGLEGPALSLARRKAHRLLEGALSDARLGSGSGSTRTP